MSGMPASQRARVIGRLLVAAAGSAVVAGLAAPSASAAGLTCGSVVTTSVTLTSDIAGCTGDGLVAGAPDIEINLNGHTISGSGNGNGGSGINASGGFEKVTVFNGTIKNFNKGVWVKNSATGAVTNLTIAGNLYGVVMDATTSKVAANTLIGTDGAAGIGVLIGGRENRVSNNAVQGFRYNGILLADNASATTVDSNTVTGAGWGIFVDGQGITVTNNTARYNTYNGIEFDRPHCTDFNGCYPGGTGSVTGNHADHNGSDGINLWNSPISVGFNVTTYNGGHGIYAVPGVTDLHNDRAFGNQTNLQCVNVYCA